MTEQEWRTCDDPQAMALPLYYSDATGMDRKRLLLCIATMRRIWHLLVDERSRRAVELMEHMLDNDVNDQDVVEMSEAAREAWGAVAERADEGRYATPMLRALPDAGLAAWHAFDGDLQCLGNASAAIANFEVAARGPEWDAARRRESLAQVNIIRCIFGNPFHPVEFKERWLSSEVRDLIRTCDERGKNDDLVEIAGALQRAGCDNPETLQHCRMETPHVRGCWVIETLLGRGLVPGEFTGDDY